MDFISCKLNEVLKCMHSGGTPSTEIKEYWNGSIKWLSSGETSQKFIFDTINKITEDGVKKSSTRLAKKNSVVMACAGQGKTRGQTSFLMDDMYINQSIIAMQANDKILPLYLFYNLSNRYDELRWSSDASSTRGSITTLKLKNLSFKYPNLEIQQEIVNVLYCYDKLIENNNKRIKILEQMVENLYKEWFVRFRFPGYEKAEFENGIPKDWEIKKVKDFCRIFTGKKDVNQTDRNGKYLFFSCSPDEYRSNDYMYDGNAIIVAGNGSYTGRVRFFSGPFDLYQRTYAIVMKETELYERDEIYYIYSRFKFDFEKIYIGGTRGAAIPYIVLKDLTDYRIFYNKNIVNLFICKIKSIYSEINKISDINKNLQKQRDALLPKLMSGKLEI